MAIYGYWVSTAVAGVLFYITLRLTGDPLGPEKALSFLITLAVISAAFTAMDLRKRGRRGPQRS